jgi:putative transposase
MPNLLNFKPFDESGYLRIYQNGFLPHWRQPGCTYFVTFRLADSIPQEVLDEWKYERDTWLTARGIDPYVLGWAKAMTILSKADRVLFDRTFTTKMFQYLDMGHGACWLRAPDISKIVADSLMHFHSQRLEIGDFVIMPNHVHALITPLFDFELEELLHSLKSFTANQINRKLNRSGVLWMEESYDHIVRDRESLGRIQSYIRANPDKANLPDTQYHLYQAEYA